MLDALGLPSGADAQRAFKADLVDTVGREAGAVLLDPDVSWPDVGERVAPGVDVLVRVEADDVETADGLRQSQLVPELGAEGARALGADAAKLMVFVRADREDGDGHTARLVPDPAGGSRGAGSA